MIDFEKDPKAQHLAIESIFVVVDQEKKGFLCLQAQDKNYFMVFSSHELAKEYWDGARIFTGAQIVQIPKHVVGAFMTDLLQEGPIALDAVRAEDGELKQFSEITAASLIEIPRYAGQA